MALLVAVAGFTTFHAAGAPQSVVTISRVLQPFVDRHTMAGAVTLVATKDKMLSLDAVGYPH